MATSSRLWVNNELYPQETSIVTLYRVLPRQWLNLFTIISSPKKFAKCLYCNASPPPILPILSRFIEFTCHMQLYSRTVIYSLYNRTNHIHSYKVYIHTSILSRIHTFMHTQHIYNIICNIPLINHESFISRMYQKVNVQEWWNGEGYYHAVSS